jgi:hypothetical protein
MPTYTCVCAAPHRPPHACMRPAALRCGEGFATHTHTPARAYTHNRAATHDAAVELLRRLCDSTYSHPGQPHERGEGEGEPPGAPAQQPRQLSWNRLVPAAQPRSPLSETMVVRAFVWCPWLGGGWLGKCGRVTT